MRKNYDYFFWKKNIAVAGIMFVFLLISPFISPCQKKQEDKNNKGVDEWKEIFKMRDEFVKNQFGSRY
ncbi:MAG: hypothetical protein WCL06_06595, partial [Bacteroidota bacterium]